MAFCYAAVALLLSSLVAASPVSTRQSDHNDFSCVSVSHPNPVVMFHGLGATYYEDLSSLESYLKQEGFCTFSITYGAYPQFPYVGGLKPINESAVELADFVRTVHAAYPSAKVDFVGHSEGAFQTLYVAKFEGVSSFVDRIFAIATPTHGSTASGIFSLAYVGGNATREQAGEALDAFGCAACNDMGPDGPAVVALNNGPIVQPGNNVTILVSKYDQGVTPTYSAFVNETGVRNLYVQDFCPNDPVGHTGEAYDQNIWTLVLNTLNKSLAGPSVCVPGQPGR